MNKCIRILIVLIVLAVFFLSLGKFGDIISKIVILFPGTLDSLYIFILMIPFLLMLYIIIDKNTDWWYMPAFGWVSTFILFLYKGSFAEGNYNIDFFDSALNVPLFVPITAFLGAISYVTVSILKHGEQHPSPPAWKHIRCAYGRRLLMAPYIAIIALFTISGIISPDAQNQWPIVFFAYFVGLYTKAIEGTLEEIGMKFLTENQKIDMLNREVNDSEIVKTLGASTSIAHKLKAQGIIKICDLVAMREEDIEQIAKKAGVGDSYLIGLIEKAKKIPDEK